MRSKDAFMAAYLITAATVRGYVSLAAYVQLTSFLFVLERLESASRSPVVVIEEDAD